MNFYTSQCFWLHGWVKADGMFVANTHYRRFMPYAECMQYTSILGKYMILSTSKRGRVWIAHNNWNIFTPQWRGHTQMPDEVFAFDYAFSDRDTAIMATRMLL